MARQAEDVKADLIHTALIVIRANLSEGNYQGAKNVYRSHNGELQDRIAAQLTDDEKAGLGLLTRRQGIGLESALRQLVINKERLQLGQGYDPGWRIMANPVAYGFYSALTGMA